MLLCQAFTKRGQMGGSLMNWKAHGHQERTNACPAKRLCERQNKPTPRDGCPPRMRAFYREHAEGSNGEGLSRWPLPRRSGPGDQHGFHGLAPWAQSQGGPGCLLGTTASRTVWQGRKQRVGRSVACDTHGTVWVWPAAGLQAVGHAHCTRSRVRDFLWISVADRGWPLCTGSRCRGSLRVFVCGFRPTTCLQWSMPSRLGCGT